MLNAHSIEKLAEVHPELARRVKQLAEILSFDLVVTCGLRTWAEQDALFDQGRTQPGSIVTKAPGGHSAHNFGYAVDVAPSDGVGIDWSGKDAKWNEILSKAPSCGLNEGAMWRTFPDEPHLYLQECPANPDDTMRWDFQEKGMPAVWASFKLS